jgi:hypothetical protein
MSRAFAHAARRLATGWSPGVWVGVIRQAFEAQHEGGALLPPHWLIALWEPPSEARPLLPRWPAVAAIAPRDSQQALLELMRHVPADARVWLSDEVADWALIARIVLDTDRHLEDYHRRGLTEFIERERAAERIAIAHSYSDRDPGYEAMKRRLLGGDSG